MLASMGRRKFLLRKCRAECSEKGGGVDVTQCDPASDGTARKLSGGVCLVLQSCVRVCVSVSANPLALDPIKRKKGIVKSCITCL